MLQWFMLLGFILQSCFYAFWPSGARNLAGIVKPEKSEIQSMDVPNNYQVFIPYVPYVSLNPYAVAMVSNDEGWMVGYYGCIYHYSNAVWQPYTSPTNAALRSIEMISANEGWAVGDQGTILHYRNGTWSIDESHTTDNLVSVTMNSQGEGWAVGGNTTVHYLNGYWEKVASPPVSGLNSVAMGAPGEAWAVGYQPGTAYRYYEAILHFTNGAWDLLNVPGEWSPYIMLNSIDMISENEGWAVGLYCVRPACFPEIAHFSNGTWVLKRGTDDLSPGLNAVDMSSPDEGWAVGDYGFIMHKLPGIWWQGVSSPVTKKLIAVSMSSADEGWIIAEGGVVLHYMNGSWQIYSGQLMQKSPR